MGTMTERGIPMGTYSRKGSPLWGVVGKEAARIDTHELDAAMRDGASCPRCGGRRQVWIWPAWRCVNDGTEIERRR